MGKFNGWVEFEAGLDTFTDDGELFFFVVGVGEENVDIVQPRAGFGTKLTVEATLAGVVHLVSVVVEVTRRPVDGVGLQRGSDVGLGSVGYL